MLGAEGSVLRSSSLLSLHRWVQGDSGCVVRGMGEMAAHRPAASGRSTTPQDLSSGVCRSGAGEAGEDPGFC